MARQIFAAEISHEDAPIYIREQMSGDEALLERHLQRLRLKLDEVFILSSCNRFMIYAVSESIDPIVDFFSGFSVLQGYVQYYYNSEESITHLFAVASGLLSPIKGDPLVLDQIAQAHHNALKYNSIGITLDNLLCQALAMGKRVRTETGIDKFCSSVIDTGIELLYDRLDGLHNKKFVIIGTGKIARLTARHLYNEGIQNVKIIGRDSARAADLANLYYLQSGEFSQLQQEVAEADVVIGGTHYEVSLFTDAFLAKKVSSDKIWFVLDFGMPRNFNNKIADHPNVELYNLDDLKRLHKSPLEAFGGIEAAWSIVMVEARSFMQMIEQFKSSPILAVYWNRQLRSSGRQAVVVGSKSLSRIDMEMTKNYMAIPGESVLWSLPPHHLTNNLKAENAKQWLKQVKGFAAVQLNVSEN